MGKYQEETKPPIAIDDNEIFEIRPDGMRETNLFTFSFCAPWLKVSQMHASKKEANDFRLKVMQKSFSYFSLYDLLTYSATLHAIY